VTPILLEAALGGLILVVVTLGLALGADRRRELGVVVLAGLLGLLGLALAVDIRGPFLGGAFVVDELARFLKPVFLTATLLAVLGGLAGQAPSMQRRALEYHVLVLTSLLGMLVLASARELTLLFVAFELMSIPLYVLAGFGKRDPSAIEAALKFFLVGSLSTALFAYGLSFLYGRAGTTMVAEVVDALGRGDRLLVLGFLLVLAGVGFKIAAFPFHMWAPDTYQAAATPFVAWLSVAPKAAGFVVLLRLFVGGGERAIDWMPFLAGLGAISVVGGNLMALPQTDAKRLLAYSGIAHVGYMLFAIAVMSPDGAAVVLFYLVAYVFSNMGAFLVVEAVAQADGATAILSFRGLAQRAPLLALCMLLFLLSLGGIPFVVGFWAKLYVFWAVAEARLYLLVLLGAVLTVVALFYYLMVAREMYIEAPTSGAPVPVPAALAVVVTVSALAVTVLGLWPGPLVDMARAASAPLFQR
jgi:NADH-quinone oxidoreductase subunit N